MANKSNGANIWGLDTRVKSATLSSSIYKLLGLWNLVPYTHAFGTTVSGSNPYMQSSSLGAFATQTIYYNSIGVEVGSSAGSLSIIYTVEGFEDTSYSTYSNYPPNTLVTVNGFTSTLAYEVSIVAGTRPDPWAHCNAVFRNQNIQSGSWAVPTPSYASVYAADVLAGHSGTRSIVYTSDQTILVSQIQEYIQAGPEAWTRYKLNHIEYWNGNGTIERVEVYQNSSTFEYTETVVDSLSYTVPDNCVGPLNPIPPAESIVAGIDESTLVNTGLLEDITDKTGLPSDQIAYGFLVTYSDSNVFYPVATIERYIVFSIYRYLETAEEAASEGRARQYEYLYQASAAQLHADWLAIRDEIDLQIRTTRALGDSGLILQQAAPHAQWYVWQEALQSRRDARFLDDSNQYLAAFRAASPASSVLPKLWANRIRMAAPWSDHTYRNVPLTLALSDVVTNPVAGTTVTTRTATYSYTVDRPDGMGGVDTVVVSQVIVGTKTEVTTLHDYGAIADYDSSTVTTYVDYVDGAPGTHSLTIQPSYITEDLQLLKKFNISGTYYYADFSGVVNGVVVKGLQVIHGSSAYGKTPDDPRDVIAGYSPSYPNFGSSYTSTLPSIVLQYRSEVPLIYEEGRVQDSSFNTWNDSHLTAGMLVRAVLYGPSGKGIFGDWAVTDTKADVYGYLEFRYDYALAALIFTRWVPATQETINTVYGPVPKPLSVFRGKGSNTRENSVVVFSNIKWPDVKRTAKAQRALLLESRNSVTEEQTTEYLVAHAVGLL